MTRYENHCLDCGLHCIGDTCPHINVEVTYCDECGEEIDGDIYEADGDVICESCLLDRFRKDY